MSPHAAETIPEIDQGCVRKHRQLSDFWIPKHGKILFQFSQNTKSHTNEPAWDHNMFVNVFEIPKSLKRDRSLF